jgi:signal transduction histidine kinase
MVIVEIEDDGPGIEPADMDRVFEPFHRGEPSRSRETGGVGLGLPIARNIMLAHGGDVTLANRASGGLKATVTLPV